MQSINCKIKQLFFIACFGFMFLQPQSAFAKCGGVDYSWGADALSNAHDFTVTMMLYEIFEQNHTHISYLQIKLKVFINHL